MVRLQADPQKIPEAFGRSLNLIYRYMIRKPAPILIHSFFLVAGLSFVVGCTTYQTKVAGARDALRSGQPERAVVELEPLAKKQNDDQLVYLLDYATALQEAGRYKESMKAFAEAERISEIQDYHSISNIAQSAILSETAIQYKGDDYEKVMINAVNAINYLETGDLDEALVEVRKLNQKLYKYKTEAKKDYEQNPFAYYLSAIIWEADKKWDDAYIAYKAAFELIPEYTPLKQDLLRLARRAQRTEDLSTWKSKFGDVEISPLWKEKSTGELIVILQQGWGPRKEPRPENPRYPYLVPVRNYTQTAAIEINGKREAQTTPVFSVQDVAIKTLNDDYGRLVASRVGGMVTKAVLSDQIRQKDEILGLLAWVVLNAADQADLRQWSTLPQTFQIARIPLKSGKYTVKATGIDGYGQPTGEQLRDREIEIKPGQKLFVNWRTLR